MSDVLKLTARLTLEDKPFVDGLKRTEQNAQRTAASIEKSFKDLVGSLETIGTQMSVALTAPLTAFGVTALRASGNFESAMNRVRGITNATGEDFQRLEGLALELGASTAFSASQAADAMGNLATAGFDVEEIYAALPGVLNLAASSGLELGEAAGIVSSALRGFGLEAGEVGRVNDVISKTAVSANTDVRQLGEAFTYVAPVAQGLGFTFEETSAAIGKISDAGIQASMAGTGLRAIMTTLATRADDVGIAVRDASGNMLPFADILTQLEQKGYTAEQAMQTFGETGGPALVALLGFGSESVRNLTTELTNAGGTAERLAATRMEGLNGALAQLASAVEGLQLAIARSGLQSWAEGLVTALTGVVTRMSQLDPATLKLATAIGIVAAAIGPLLLAFVQLVKGIQAVQTAIVTLRTITLAMAGPRGWLILAATALGVVLTNAIIKATDADARFARSLGITRDQAIAYRAAVERVAGITLELQGAAEGVARPMVELARTIETSTGSAEELESAVTQVANGMTGPAKDAFVEYARQAIATGDDLETVGARIADRAKRDSLLNQVNTLAQDIDGDGRQAFINYALEAIATADTSEEAFDRILSGWARARNASTIAELEVVAAARRARIAILEAEIAAVPAERRGLAGPLRAELSELRAQLAEVEAQLGPLKGATLTFNRTTQTLTNSGVRPLNNALGDLGSSADDASTSVAASGGRAEAAAGSIAALRERIRELNAEFEATPDADRRIAIRLEVADLEAQVDLLLEDVQSAIDGSPVPVPAVTVQIATRLSGAGITALPIDLAEVRARIVALTEAQVALGTATQEDLLTALDAQVETLTRLRDGTERNTAENVRATQQLASATAARDRVAAAIEAERQATVNATAVRSAELTQTAQLTTWANENATARYRESAAATEQANRRALELEREEMLERQAALAALNSTMAAADLRLAQERLAAATAEANRANLGYQDGLVGTAADAVTFAETQLRLADALIATGDATETRAVTALVMLTTALEQQRSTLDPYSLEYAILTERIAAAQNRLNEYADAALAASEKEAGAQLESATATRENAAATFDLVTRKRDLAEATGEDVVNALTTYEEALRAEIALVGEDTEEYVALREELERILAIKNELEGNAGGAGGAIQTGAEVLQGGIQKFVEGLGVTGEAAQDFASTIMNEVPWLGAAVNGWQDLLLNLLTSTEGFGDLMEAMAGLLDPIIDVLEELFPPLVEVVNALKPIIEVAAALVSLALQPFLFVLRSVLVPAITFVANLIKTIWNGIASALNVVLGVFGVRLPTIGDRGGSGDAGPQVLGSSGGVEVRADRNGSPYIFFTGEAPAAGSIARQRAVVAALRQAYENATTDEARSRIQNLLNLNERELANMTGEGGEETAPAEPAEPEAPRGRIGRLEARRRELQTLISESESEEDIARYNAELRSVDAELARLRGLGAEEPAAPEEGPGGLLPQLRAERADLQRQLEEARTPEEIARINDQIRDVDARINELQNLTLRPPEEQPAAATGLITRLEAERRDLQEQLARAETPAEIARLNDSIRRVDAQLADLRALTLELPEEIGDEVGDEIRDPIERAAPDFTFGGAAQSVQLAVATPLLDASLRMLEASQNMQRIFGATETGGLTFTSVIPPFTNAIERMTPVLERLLAEGVAVNLAQSNASSGGSSTAFLRGV